MNILIRADSSSTIGTGHIMRDLVLASQLQKEFPHADIIFATQNLDGNINHKIIESGYKVITLSSNTKEGLLDILNSLHVEMLVIDHYGINYKFEEELKTKNPKLKIMVLDDTYEQHYCDILLNHNIYADEKKYKDLVPPYCELRCGAIYILIRDEFRDEKNTKREKIYDIFIAMGGADTAELNIPVLKALPQNLKVAVLTTNANRALQTLKEFVQNRPNITMHINSNEVAKLLNQSRFAIVTPSVTVHEVLFMEIPFLAIKTAQNQNEMYEYLKKKKFLVLGEFSNLVEKISKIEILKKISGK